MPDQAPDQVEQKYAFRCLNCGRLHEADHAGECNHPHACQVCGSGVVFRHQELAEALKIAISAGNVDEALRLADEVKRCDPASKRLVPENWEILAEASNDRLSELGLLPKHVCKHTAWARGEVPANLRPRHFAVSAVEGLQTIDATKHGN